MISSDGYVVTNNHVVANGVSFEVTIDSGKTYQAKVMKNPEPNAKPDLGTGASGMGTPK
jgi:S1-C subfamily serine protease